MRKQQERRKQPKNKNCENCENRETRKPRKSRKLREQRKPRKRETRENRENCESRETRKLRKPRNTQKPRKLREHWKPRKRENRENREKRKTPRRLALLAAFLGFLGFLVSRFLASHRSGHVAWISCLEIKQVISKSTLIIGDHSISLGWLAWLIFRARTVETNKNPTELCFLEICGTSEVPSPSADRRSCGRWRLSATSRNASLSYRFPAHGYVQCGVP